MRSRRSRPTGFIAPCLPSAAERPPAELGWIHEIKHRGHRVMARRSSAGLRLFTRNGLDWSERYPAEKLERLGLWFAHKDSAGLSS